jgi:hypothetical protein
MTKGQVLVVTVYSITNCKKFTMLRKQKNHDEFEKDLVQYEWVWWTFANSSSKTD